MPGHTAEAHRSRRPTRHASQCSITAVFLAPNCSGRSQRVVALRSPLILGPPTRIRHSMRQNREEQAPVPLTDVTSRFGFGV